MENQRKVVTISAQNSSKALGVAWETNDDKLTLTAQIPDRPFTRRGVLSSVNSLFDPIGMAAPIILGGRVLQREMMTHDVESPLDWDSPLPEDLRAAWIKWKESVDGFHLSIPRCLFPDSSLKEPRLYAFSDASAQAIGFVIYASCLNNDGDRIVSFVTAGSKVAPKSATTIPRLELCAALEASIALKNVQRELNVPMAEISCFTDSMIVLGYMHNARKAFSRYVTRRIQAIQSQCPIGLDWKYVSTNQNPADHASKPTTPSVLVASNWFTGPEILQHDNFEDTQTVGTNYGNLPEAIPATKVLRSATPPQLSPLGELVKRCSSWLKCIRITQRIASFLRKWRNSARNNLGLSPLSSDPNVTYCEANEIIVRSAQRDNYPEAFMNNGSHVSFPEGHTLSGLAAFVDDTALLRVGGRLRNSLGSFETKHPVVLPKEHPVAERVAEYCHEACGHQGRVISHSELRNRGYFIVKGKTLINNVIARCNECKRTRGNTAGQMMADLPPERVVQSAPFDNVGIDVFGPFLVHDGITTRRSKSTKKMYGLLITCLSSRAIHIEPLIGLDTASFINALRRFTAIRGPCKSILSDRGSNFVGAISSIDFKKVENDISSRDCVWKMNPPGASHFGGVYERKIGSVRRVLEGFLIKSSSHHISRDEMTTLLQEAASIVNSTPLYGFSDDPHDPVPLSPAMILTMKVEPSRSLKNVEESDLASYGRHRWKKVQLIADEFWKYWSSIYLSNLIERNKWKTPRVPIKVGNVVIVRSKNLPRSQWILGLVEKVFKGSDGLVRRAMVKVCPNNGRNRTVEKAIHDLVPLCT